MIGFVIRTLIAAAGLWIATQLVSGIAIADTTTLVLAGVLLGVVNAIVRPIAFILTLPITLLTLGLFLLVINAAMVGLVAWFLPGFHVASFWAALFAALIVSITGWVGSALFGPGGKAETSRR